MSDEQDVAGLADRIDALVEELDEIAFTRLRIAAAEGATARPPADRRLTAARRALEKAAHLLRTSG